MDVLNVSSPEDELVMQNCLQCKVRTLEYIKEEREIEKKRGQGVGGLSTAKATSVLTAPGTSVWTS